jgi:hypothetical protein
MGVKGVNYDLNIRMKDITNITDIALLMRQFREEKPAPQSPRMIELIGQMVETYDALGEIILPADQMMMEAHVGILVHLQKVKKHFLEENWKQLAHDHLLYGADRVLEHWKGE